MKRKFWILAAIAALTINLVACDDDDDDETTGDTDTGNTDDTASGDDDDSTSDDDDDDDDDDDAPVPQTIDVSGEITSDQTWEGQNTYVLKDYVFVKNATLTVEAGATVKGGNGSALLITNTAKIIAEGTKEKPIVFTSNLREGTRLPGNWGGLVLLGKAPINVSGGTNKIEGFAETQTGTEYGGSDAKHNCGTLKYVRVEFAGFELAKDNELNGVTLGGCGSDTVVDYLQVHKGSDDLLEIFGGTVNVKHVVLSQGQDDALDWDFGWTGKAQYLIAQLDAANSENGVEADSEKDNNDATPRSNPTLYNVTFVGGAANPGEAGKTQSGFLFRRGTAGKIYNAVVQNFGDFAIQVTDARTGELATEGALAVFNSVFFNNSGAADGFAATAIADDETTADKDESFDFDNKAAFIVDGNNNKLGEDPKLAAPTNQTAPNFKPASPIAGGATPPSDGFFDAAGTFVGAVGGDDWTAGWTSFAQN